MTTQADLEVADHKVVRDERVKERNRLQRLLIRPEMGAGIGAIGIFVFFLIVADPFRQASSLATVLYASSTIGIMACGVAVLMIGGEFDLSTGVAVTFSSLAASMLAYNLHLNLWAGAGLALILALTVGFFNGYLVMKTKIPSFLITLSTFFMLAGINLAVTKLVSGQVATQSVSDMQGWDSAQKVFASSFTLFGVSIRITVVWWLVFTAVATWVLFKTKIGNWIFAVGGDAESARAVGVPVTKVKIGLFMFVGFCAWFVGMHLLFCVQHGSVRPGHRQRVLLHHRRGHRWLPADRWLRHRHRRGHRCVHLRHDQPGHRLRGLESRLVQVLPGRDAAVRGDRQQRLP